MDGHYLGDSKDSFKWDYHDYLVSRLGYSTLYMVPMMTPDDGGNDGKSHPSKFSARREIINFCNELRQSRSIETIRKLPTKTRASYKVRYHREGIYFNNSNRRSYFSNFSKSEDQLVFLDPDNGFEPEKSCSEKHVGYDDLSQLLGQLSDESVVSVFQNFRRVGSAIPSFKTTML